MANKQADEETEEETLVEAIRSVSRGVESLRKSGLNRRAIIVLIHDATRNIGMREIGIILDTLPELADRYCAKGESGEG